VLDPQSASLPSSSLTSNVSASSKSYRPDVQGLRAVAVALVILYHARFWVFGGGFVGVDVFFVISGFVITGHLLRHSQSSIRTTLADFYARRIRRIVPAATVVLVLTLILGYNLLGSNFDPALVGDAKWASLFSANFRFIHTSSGYFIAGIPPSLVQHFWSLAVEEQFYFVWPLVLLAATRLAPAAYRRHAVGLVLIVIIVASAWWSWHDTLANATEAYYSPFTRAWEIALGALVAVSPRVGDRLSPLAIQRIAMGSLFALLISATLQRSPLSFPGFAAWLPCGAAAVLLWSGTSSQPSLTARWLSHPAITAIGDRSYSLYLYHFAWLEIPLQMVHPASGFFVTTLEIAGTAVCAELSFRYLENPIRRSRRLDRDRVSVLLLLLVCVAAVFDTAWWVGHLAGV